MVLVAVSGGPDSVALLDVLAELAPRLDLRLAVGHVHHGLRAEAEARCRSRPRARRAPRARVFPRARQCSARAAVGGPRGGGAPRPPRRARSPGARHRRRPHRHRPYRGRPGGDRAHAPLRRRGPARPLGHRLLARATDPPAPGEPPRRRPGISHRPRSRLGRGRVEPRPEHPAQPHPPRGAAVSGAGVRTGDHRVTVPVGRPQPRARRRPRAAGARGAHAPRHARTQRHRVQGRRPARPLHGDGPRGLAPGGRRPGGCAAAARCRAPGRPAPSSRRRRPAAPSRWGHWSWSGAAGGSGWDRSRCPRSARGTGTRRARWYSTSSASGSRRVASIGPPTTRRRARGTAWRSTPMRSPRRFIVRPRRRGERFAPFGGPEERRLKSLLSDAGIPRWERSRIPLLEADGRTVWVVGLRRGRMASIGPHTKRILEVTVLPL